MRVMNFHRFIFYSHVFKFLLSETWKPHYLVHWRRLAPCFLNPSCFPESTIFRLASAIFLPRIGHFLGSAIFPHCLDTPRLQIFWLKRDFGRLDGSTREVRLRLRVSFHFRSNRSLFFPYSILIFLPIHLISCGFVMQFENLCELIRPLCYLTPSTFSNKAVWVKKSFVHTCSLLWFNLRVVTECLINNMALSNNGNWRSFFPCGCFYICSTQACPRRLNWRFQCGLVVLEKLFDIREQSEKVYGLWRRWWKFKSKNRLHKSVINKVRQVILLQHSYFIRVGEVVGWIQGLRGLKTSFFPVNF